MASALQNLKIYGEKIISDSSSTNQFVNKFSGITKDFSKHQIYNSDKTGIVKVLKNVAWIYLSTSTLLAGYGTKKPNASGTIKLPLLLIGKTKNPPCFCNLNKEALTVVYRNQANAWISCDIFQDWFF